MSRGTCLDLGTLQQDDPNSPIRQVEENANAMQFGPLQPGQMTEIETNPSR